MKKCENCGCTKDLLEFTNKSTGEKVYICQDHWDEKIAKGQKNTKSFDKRND